MRPLGPYNLPATSQTPLTIEWDQLAQPPIGIDLQNNSGLLLQAQIAGQSQWIQPWTASYFVLPQATISILVIPQASSVGPSYTNPLLLTANVYQVGDIPPSPALRPLSASSVGVVASSGVRASATLISVTPQIASVPILSTDRSITVIVICQGTASISLSDIIPIQVVGNQSGIIWSVTTQAGLQQQVFSAPTNSMIITMPVWGVVDQTLNVRPDIIYGASGSALVWVIGQPDGQLLGMSNEPLVTRVVNPSSMPIPTQPQKTSDGHGTYTVWGLVLSTTLASLLAVPAAGSAYDITQIALWQTTALTATGTLSMRNTSTPQENFLVLPLPTGQVGVIVSPARFILADGISVQGAQAAGGVAQITYRVVPNTFTI